MTNTDLNNRLLIIEDDESFASILSRRLERHNYKINIANNVEQGVILAEEHKPQFILIDMKIGSNNGLHILPKLRDLLPQSRIILLTGYASIATAVESIKSGADDYLSKPIDTANLLAALQGKEKIEQQIESNMSPARLEWEHIQQVLKLNQGNVSETARQLGMHRRTLQRKLAKKPHIN